MLSGLARSTNHPVAGSFRPATARAASGIGLLFGRYDDEDWVLPGVVAATRRGCAGSPLRYARRGKETPAADDLAALGRGRDGGRQAARGPAASSSLIFSSSRSVTSFRSWRFSNCNSATMSARPRLAP